MEAEKQKLAADKIEPAEIKSELLLPFKPY
jgi:hypothetical protein